MCVCTRVYVRAFPDRQDEVVYYDAFETADDITEENAEDREELRRLQAGARQLEARRGRIIAKRSYLRNKRVRAHVNRVCARGRGLNSILTFFLTTLVLYECTMLCGSLPVFRSCRRSACPTTLRSSRNVKASTRAPCPSSCSR